MEIRVQKAYCDPSFGNIDILCRWRRRLRLVRNVSPRWLDSAYYTTLAVSVSSSCCHQESPQRHIKKLSGEALHMKRVNQKHLHDS